MNAQKFLTDLITDIEIEASLKSKKASITAVKQIVLTRRPNRREDPRRNTACRAGKMSTIKEEITDRYSVWQTLTSTSKRFMRGNRLHKRVGFAYTVVSHVSAVVRSSGIDVHGPLPHAALGVSQVKETA